MSPPPHKPKPNATIIFYKSVVIQNMILLLEKTFHKFVEHVETNPLIFNTLHFDKYSCLTIRLKKLWF